MGPDALFHRYQKLQRYVGWTDDDARRIASVAAILEPHFPALIDDFYDEIDRHPEARKVITGGTAQIQRLKGTLLDWLHELVAGRYDRDYVARRWRVGWRHVEIGLDQVFTNVALSRLRRGLLLTVESHQPPELSDALAVRRSLNTLLDLDLAIIEDAYQAEYAARQRRSERLAALGQVAHEIDRLNKDLQHRVTELQTLLEVIPIGIGIAQDPACQHIHANRALAGLLGIDPGANASYSPPSGCGQPYRVLRNGHEVAAEELPMQTAARGEEVREFELEIVRADGRAVTLFGSAAPLLDERGQPRGSVGVFLDVTEQRRAQDQALQSERLAAIGQMVTWLAHESGNALARSLSSLEMLQGEVEDRPEALDLIDQVRKAQEQLRRLYSELRNYAGPLKLEREPWELSLVWRQAWENLAVLRRGRDTRLTEMLDTNDVSCAIDPFRLDQVFRNILENALAACRDPVRIIVRCSETVLEGRPAVCVSVLDNGPGLTAEQRQRIFEPFYTTKAMGTGLGMAIAWRVVEAHGGRIVVGSATSGAEIVVTLPRAAS
jgi:signal transduction histidine kinase